METAKDLIIELEKAINDFRSLSVEQTKDITVNDGIMPYIMRNCPTLVKYTNDRQTAKVAITIVEGLVHLTMSKLNLLSHNQQMASLAMCLPAFNNKR